MWKFQFFFCLVSVSVFLEVNLLAHKPKSSDDLPMVKDNMHKKQKRANCHVCEITPQKCEVVTNYYTKRKMTEGYHFMYSIPESACNVSILDEKSSGNFLALRWKLSKEYFLNGNWIVKGSGNYTAKQNFFLYFNPTENSNNSGQWIKFYNQLTQAVDVDLIYQSENHGVEFSYLLPPFIEKTLGDQKRNSVEGKQSSSVVLTPFPTNPTYIAHKDYHYPHQSLLNLRQSHQSDQNKAPKWLSELKKLLNLWLADLGKTKKDLEETKVRVTKVEQRASNLEYRADTVENRMTKVESRATKLENRATNLERRALAVEGKAKALEQRAKALEDRTKALEDKTTRVESRTSNVEAKATKIGNNLYKCEVHYNKVSEGGWYEQPFGFWYAEDTGLVDVFQNYGWDFWDRNNHGFTYYCRKDGGCDSRVLKCGRFRIDDIYKSGYKYNGL